MRGIQKLLSTVLIVFAFIEFNDCFADAPKPQVELFVELNPVGSFVAKSDAVTSKGETRDKAGVIRAERVELKLDTLKTGIALRDEHMIKKYFEAEKYPSAVLTNLVAENGKFKANLNIRNKDKAIEGTYTLDGASGTAEFSVALSDFNIPAAKYMGVGVEDTVKVKVKGPVPPITEAPKSSVAEQPAASTPEKN